MIDAEAALNASLIFERYAQNPGAFRLCRAARSVPNALNNSIMLNRDGGRSVRSTLRSSGFCVSPERLPTPSELVIVGGLAAPSWPGVHFHGRSLVPVAFGMLAHS